MLGLPIYLVGSVYYLHTRIAGRQVKRSLGTSYKREALRRALALLQELAMTQKPLSTYTLDIERGIMQAEGEEDHARMMQALAAMAGLRSAASAANGALAPTLGSKNADEASDREPHTNSHALKLNELLEKFFLLRKHLKQATALAYRNCIDEFARFLKNPVITRITASDVTRYQENLAEKGNSVRTIDNKISIIRALFNFAKKQGYTRQDNPAQNRALLTKKQRIKGGYAIFEKEEIQAFFASEFYQEQKNKDPDYTNAVLLGLFTGCRVGEITNLTREQFKISAAGINYITIRDSKTLAGIREIPIHPLAFKTLAPFLNSKKDKIFKYIEKDGKGAGNAVGKKFSRNLESASISRDKLVFHSLRKFVNNELLNAGVNIECRCQLMGHELDNVNVSTYTRKLTIDDLANAVFPTFEAIHKLITPQLKLPDDLELSW